MSEADDKLLAHQFAIELILSDVLVRLYLLAPDPTQEATNHRARLRFQLKTNEQVATLSLDEESSYCLIADAVDEILEAAGRRASALAAGDGR